MSSYDKILELVKVMELEGDEKKEFIKKELEKAEKREREERDRADKEKDRIEKDKDREERAAERAHQKELKELETKQRESQDKVELAKLEAAKTNPNIITQQSTTKPFISKFHKYNSKDETLENYLVQFEHIASTYNFNNEDMAKHLLANLSGEPLNIISTLTVDQKKDYAAVKTRLLEHFGKNSDFYRKLFRDTKLKKDGDFNRIIFDMRTNMIKWLELAKCDIKDPTQILDMLLIDNVLNNVTDLVFTFLKEKKIKTETELITNLNLFKDSHPGHTIDKRDLYQLAATATTSNNNYNDKYKWSNTKTCFNCGRRGHVKNQCKAPINYNNNYRYRSYTNFYNPNSYKHNNNYNNRPYRPHQSASPNERRNFTNSYQHNNYNRNNRQSRRDQFNYHTNNHPNNYNSGNRNNRNNNGNNTNTHREENVAYMQSNKSKIKVFPSYVNSKEVGSIRDSGATAIIVKASLVEPGQYLEVTVKVTYANIQKFDICKTAKVLIESPWITGELEAIVMDTPAQDLIIGNVEGVKDPTLEEVMQWAEDRQKYSLFKHEALLVETRSHTKITPEIECPTVLLNEIGITREELIAMQKNDTTIQDLLSKDYNKINLNNHHIEINNLAIRYNRKENCTRLQILIPKTLRAKILNMAHDDPTAGHLGKKKVYAKIANKFFWPKMGKDIKNYVNSCTECAKQKTVTRAPLEKSYKSHYFWDKIAMDIMGPLTTSSKGNKYILGIIDMSTRWAEAFPLKDIKAIDICNCLKTLFLKFGFPNKLLSDNASNFKSHLNQAFAEMTNIRLVHSTIYSPQGNGVIEKWNRTVKQMIYKLERDSMSTWDQTLSYAIFAYNTSIHETTKFSPYELVFNRKPKGPLELWADNMLNLENIEQYHPWIIQTKQQLRQGIKLAEINMDKNLERHRKIKNRNRKLRTLNVGDQVFVKIENKHCKDKNEGPFKVIERINNKVYIIDKDGRECKLNIDKLVKLDKRQITDTDIIELDVETKHNIQERIASTINTTHNSSPNIENDMLQNLTVKYSDVITQKLGCTNLIEHTIKHYQLRQKPIVSPKHTRT
ncbi:uncharacterized protein LOC129922301 [Biomphalaria glabrata]|uniref:Uncharacterized protein LOC129922301 n=1 Tax=Biomphalaria glabrata TaxID=6526 RepID=A0A9W2YM59_BIOGL|nr:uncharacterized protein LOC129922301 [Biomphalaria glabrata]